MYRDLTKHNTAPIHDPTKHVNVAANTPYVIPIALVNAHPAPNTNNVGGINRSVATTKIDKNVITAYDGWYVIQMTKSCNHRMMVEPKIKS
jgi:hypothetical protein